MTVSGPSGRSARRPSRAGSPADPGAQPGRGGAQPLDGGSDGGVAVLGESLSWNAPVGAAIVLLGALVSRDRRRASGPG
jgi:hypothetical protein